MMPCPTFDRFVADIAGGDTALEYRIWECWDTTSRRIKCDSSERMDRYIHTLKAAR